MRLYLTTIFILFASLPTKATGKDSTFYYNLPDSVKAVQFMAEVSVQSYDKNKRFELGIKTDTVRLLMTSTRQGKYFIFYPYASLNNIQRGWNTGFDLMDFGISFRYDWGTKETYKLLISQATDSAGNFSIYGGYVFLPRENKWKFLGSAKIEKKSTSIQKPAFSYFRKKNLTVAYTINQVWVQRQNGSWKNLQEETLPPPVINLYGHIDSVQQHQAEIKLIEDAIASGKTDVKNNEQGVYYSMIKEGAGRQVTADDTVTVRYKGYLFANDSVFDQTKEKPATFPLKRLIRGWQIGVPLCKVGGKIKLVIPSGIGYSVRTRAAKIPPNSILVFEIEVLDAKAPERQPGN